MKEAAGAGARIKSRLKKLRTAAGQRSYVRQMDKRMSDYDSWIRETENRHIEALTEQGNCGRLHLKKVPYDDCRAYMENRRFEEDHEDFLLFTARGGAESEHAAAFIGEFCRSHPQTVLLYGDEDLMSPQGIRYTPWLKPDWSPDTFLSNFYFGSVFAVRPSALKALTDEEILSFWETDRYEKEDMLSGIYRLCFCLARRCGGYGKRVKQGETDGFSIGHVSEILFHTWRNRETELLYNQGILEETGPEEKAAETDGERIAVSVIIPSKDNAPVLKRCIESIEREAAIPYEILVVDNGSEERTKKELEAYLEERQAVYLYHPMPFHFSRMCNLGAERASGSVCLFLNDDVEAPVGTDFLTELYRQARKSYAGAAGAKLLYPETGRIQHAGIVNLRLGPVHKLQFKEDNDCYYFGWNRGTRNVLAVTGACLAVTRKKFWAAGGFPEELPVAFNDVDLCFSLWEKGFYNAVLQEVVLLHHESMSRGRDEEPEKLERLIAERRRLYERHTEMYGKDPFYNGKLASDMLSTGFELKADYEREESIPYAGTMCLTGIPRGAREDACVIVSLEYAGGLREWESGIPVEADDYYIQGYGFVAGSDNACYDRKIMLRREGTRELLLIKPRSCIRRDVEQNLPDQRNVLMAGFQAKIRFADIGDGSWRVGVLASGKYGGQKLYSWTNRYIRKG